ncbi:MAG: GNAT family N-acetyltransferase [Parvibaculales bacterium]
MSAAIAPSSDAAALAALHAAAFARPWDEAAFTGLLAKPQVTALASAQGFILLQHVPSGKNTGTDADKESAVALTVEAEILTLAVHPEARRQGLARRLISVAIDHLAVEKMFLEVAEDNHAAMALYQACGFAESGRRAGYYKNTDGSRSDALLMQAFF